MRLFSFEHVVPVAEVGLFELMELFLQEEELAIDFVVLGGCYVVLEQF